MTRLSIDVLGDGGAAKEYNVLVIGAATESDADLGDGEQKEEDDVAMKENDELIDSEVRCPRQQCCSLNSMLLPYLLYL